IDLVRAWLGDLPAPPQRALEANRLLRIAAESTAVTTLGELAEALHTSPRTGQRLAEDFLGLSPLQVIRRYRLQEAARHLREGTETIAGIAARLGYTDHAHLTPDFLRTFGYGHREYRAGSESGPMGIVPSQTSPNSDRIRKISILPTAAGRRRSGAFIVEGPQSVREAVEHTPG